MSAHKHNQNNKKHLTQRGLLPIIHLVADLAQLVELLICNQWVGSSSLSIGTKLSKRLRVI